MSVKKRTRILGASIICTALSVLSLAQARPTVTTIDVPGASDTYVRDMNSAGTVVGYYYPYHDYTVAHPFIRGADGTITRFSAPDGLEISAYGISSNGIVVGSYNKRSGKLSGFIRSQDGTIKRIEPPDAVLTFALRVNRKGQVAGYYTNMGTHAFVRQADGTIDEFDGPSHPSDTFALDINESGTVTGYYIDAQNIGHGFLRTADGTLTTLDEPGYASIAPNAINAAGDITGTCYTANGTLLGFIRTADGIFANFAVGSSRTYGMGIDNRDELAGYYQKNGSTLAYARFAGGSVKTLSIIGTNELSYVKPVAIHSNKIAGTYRSGNHAHGFVLLR